MAQILVKTPVTSNGRDPIMGADGKIMYKETILEAAAQKVIEKRNLKKPTHLKAIIEDYNPTKTAKVEKTEAAPAVEAETKTVTKKATKSAKAKS